MARAAEPGPLDLSTSAYELLASAAGDVELADELWAIAARRLPDGRYVALVPLTFDRRRVVVGRDVLFWHDGW